jgi:hypothetical protein
MKNDLSAQDLCVILGLFVYGQTPSGNQNPPPPVYKRESVLCLDKGRNEFSFPPHIVQLIETSEVLAHVVDKFNALQTAIAQWSSWK